MASFGCVTGDRNVLVLILY